MSTINFNFFRFSWKFIFIGQFSLLSLWPLLIEISPCCAHYAGRISNAVSAREGDLKVPKPERPPSRSHPVGHGKSVTSSMCNTVDFLSVCCGIQSGTLCRSGFLGSSIFIVVHCANLLPGFFDIYSGTLCRSASWILQYL